MTLAWSKIWRKTDVVSKMTRIWWILTRPQKSLKNLLFDWFLFVQNICLTEKIQRSYLSWHWRVMQSLKKNWCIVWKMTWGIWQIFTRALRSVKIGTLMGSFCPKQKMHELKIYRGIMWNHTEEWWKIWRGIDFLFQNWHEKFDKFWPKQLKVSKICFLMGSFWPKYIMLELKKYRGVIFHSTIKTFYTCSTESLLLRYKKISKKSVKLGSFLHCSEDIFLGNDGCFWKIIS